MLRGKIFFIFLIILHLLISSCSRNNDESWPSLAADDLWDQLEAERKKPVPAETDIFLGSDSDTSDGIPMEDTKRQPLTDKDINNYRTILMEADQKFQSQMASLQDSFIQLSQDLSDDDKIAHIRTVQLHISRLTSLRLNLLQAVREMPYAPQISGKDSSLLERGRQLVPKIAAQITFLQNRLDKASS